MQLSVDCSLPLTSALNLQANLIHCKRQHNGLAASWSVPSGGTVHGDKEIWIWSWSHKKNISRGSLLNEWDNFHISQPPCIVPFIIYLYYTEICWDFPTYIFPSKGTLKVYMMVLKVRITSIHKWDQNVCKLWFTECASFHFQVWNN